MKRCRHLNAEKLHNVFDRPGVTVWWCHDCDSIFEVWLATELARAVGAGMVSR